MLLSLYAIAVAAVCKCCCHCVNINLPLFAIVYVLLWHIVFVYVSVTAYNVADIIVCTCGWACKNQPCDECIKATNFA